MNLQWINLLILIIFVNNGIGERNLNSKFRRWILESIATTEYCSRYVFSTAFLIGVISYGSEMNISLSWNTSTSISARGDSRTRTRSHIVVVDHKSSTLPFLYDSSQSSKKHSIKRLHILKIRESKCILQCFFNVNGHAQWLRSKFFWRHLTN